MLPSPTFFVGQWLDPPCRVGRPHDQAEFVRDAFGHRQGQAAVCALKRPHRQLGEPGFAELPVRPLLLHDGVR